MYEHVCQCDCVSSWRNFDHLFSPLRLPHFYNTPPPLCWMLEWTTRHPDVFHQRKTKTDIDPKNNIKPEAMIISTKQLAFSIYFFPQVSHPVNNWYFIKQFLSNFVKQHPPNCIQIRLTSLSLARLRLCTVLPAPVARNVSTNFGPRKGCKATEMRLIWTHVNFEDIKYPLFQKGHCWVDGLVQYHVFMQNHHFSGASC